MTPQQLHEYHKLRAKDWQDKGARLSKILVWVCLIVVLSSFVIIIYRVHTPVIVVKNRYLPQRLSTRDSAKIAIDFWRHRFPTSYERNYKSK